MDLNVDVLYGEKRKEIDALAQAGDAVGMIEMLGRELETVQTGFEAVVAELASLRAENERLRNALQVMHDSKKEYIEINNLGHPYRDFYDMRVARNALSSSSQGSETDG